METVIENDLLVITPEEEGERLDKILANRFGGRNSRTYFQYLMEEGLVLLAGEPVKKRIKPRAGDEVEIHFILTPQIDLQPEAIPLDILFEDEHILVVNKPSGMVVHPAPGNWTGTFVNALLHHCHIFPDVDNTLRPGIVHRLDKDTSGVLVAAKTSAAHQKLIALFASRQIYKQYLAICLGNPGNQEIRTLIGRHPLFRKKMTVLEEGGKPAVTHCKTLIAREKFSLVQLILETGRTHQIRVHMKHQGCPILGDALYGNAGANKKYGALRQMLHAECMRFAHPITGHPLEFRAEVPQDFASFLGSISNS